MSFSRRKFIRNTWGATALAALAPVPPDFLVRSAWAATPTKAREDTVLVVIQLSGGNDGLNTVVPHGDDAYARNRPTLQFRLEELHRIDALLGFHPQMTGFMQLYGEGLLTIAHGIGCATAGQDHERAMRVWHTAADQPLSAGTGWAGRAADSLWDPLRVNLPALFVGRIAPPQGLNAANTLVPKVKSIKELALAPPFIGPDPLASRTVRLAAEYTCWMDPRATPFAKPLENPWLDSLARAQAEAEVHTQRLNTIAAAAEGNRGYPDFELAADLRVIAQLIRADLGIRLFFAEMGGGGIGGFDNHANQKGNHCALLHQLSESVLAFIRDLQRDKLLDRVLLMTFSEFGRTVKENGRRGTDHGAAAPVFLAGGRLKAGQFGAHPSLTELANGGLKVQTDFRRLYATVLDQWLRLNSRAILGQQFDTLDIVSAAPS